MILDKLNQYSDSQVVTGTVVSTNVIDHGAEVSGIGAGKEMMVMAAVEATTVNSANVTVNVQTSDTEAFTVATVIATATVLAADFVAGSKIHVPIPPDYKALKYTRLQFVAGASSGTISAYLIPQDHQDQYYASKAAVSQI